LRKFAAMVAVEINNIDDARDTANNSGYIQNNEIR
jgi:hypothetical protein